MIAIINSGIANVQSVANAFEALGCDAVITADAQAIRDARAVVLPGVGAFADGMKNLRACGLVEVLHEQVMDRGKPLLGICLGLQLLTQTGFEHGEHAGLGWVPGVAQRLTPADPALHVPHVGWNDCTIVRRAPLFAGLPERPTFYFVHSYHVVPAAEDAVAATCDYGGPFVAAVVQNNLMAVQFHPEKSHRDGLAVLKNFAAC